MQNYPLLIFEEYNAIARSVKVINKSADDVKKFNVY